MFHWVVGSSIEKVHRSNDERGADRKIGGFQKDSCPFKSFKQKLLERNCYRHTHFRNTLLMAHQTNDLSTTYNVKKVSFRTMILRKKYFNGPRAFVAFSSKLITVQDDELREL